MGRNASVGTLPAAWMKTSRASVAGQLTSEEAAPNWRRPAPAAAAFLASSNCLCCSSRSFSCCSMRFLSLDDPATRGQGRDGAQEVGEVRSRSRRSAQKLGGPRHRAWQVAMHPLTHVAAHAVAAHGCWKAPGRGRPSPSARSLRQGATAAAARAGAAVFRLMQGTSAGTGNQ